MMLSFQWSLGALKKGLAAAVVSLLVIAPQEALSDWKPERAVEIMVTTSPGSSPDSVARLLQSIWQKHDMLSVPVSIANRPGGGGTVGFAYLNQHAGDGHHLTLSSASALSNYLAGGSKIGVHDLTPISLLLSEYPGLAVRNDSPIADGKEFIERLKKDPKSLSIGMGGSRGNVNHQNVAAAARAAGIDPRDLNIVVFRSGGEARSALIGGHIDAVTATAGTFVGQMEGGLLKVIAVASPDRLEGPLSGVPTWKEMGVNAVVVDWRWAGGPKGLSDEQVAFWEGILKKTVETEEWKAFLKENQAQTTFLGAAATKDYFAEQDKELGELLGALGLKVTE